MFGEAFVVTDAELPANMPRAAAQDGVPALELEPQRLR
jgi:hypothetical protein